MILRILHLEDDPHLVVLVREALGRQGLACEVEAVDTDVKYLAALERANFDVILSDSGLPGYDGSAALIAARARCPGVPFIVVSAGETPLPGATARVPKSNLHALGPTIHSALEGVSPEREAAAASLLRGMQLLVTVVQRLSLARNLESIMAIVRRAARQLAGADGASFILRDGDRCYHADEDAIGPLWKGQRFPLTACISGWVMLNCRPAVIDDIYLDARIPQDAYRPTFVKSLMMTPIRTVAPIGAIGVYWAHTHRATPDEVNLLQALADSTATALEAVDLLMNLEKRVAEGTAELQRRSAELEVANRELEAFSYAVAHDLHAPLLTIEGFSQVLMENGAETLDANARGHLGRIVAGVRRMHRLISDLMSLSKTVRAPLIPSHVDLSQHARQIAADLSQSAPTRKAEFLIADGVTAHGDVGLLHAVLVNLMSNAWKFSSQTEAAEIEFGARHEAHRGSVYFVRDNGAGFNPLHARKLFAPFQRLHAQEEFPGSGIGLATVQRIVHRHGGRIWAESAVGDGATFYFTLAPASAAGR